MVLITFSGTLAMHMFVPALPDVARDFGASIAQVQMTISAYVLGLAGGQLIYGPLSDGLGRRPVLLAGLSLYVVGGIASLLAPEVHTLVAARFVQALGGCAGLSLGRAIVRETNHPSEALRKLALLNVVMLVGIAAAPVLGSFLSAGLGWRSLLLLLLLFGCVTLALTWRLLPETGTPSGRVGFAVAARDYRRLLARPAFVGFVFGGGCATTSIYAFFAATPFIVVDELHRPLHEAGYYLALLAVGLSLGNALTRRLIRAVSIERLLLGGNALSAMAGCTLVGIVLFAEITATSTMGLMFLFALGGGVSSPAALTKALSGDPRLIGSASGMFGFSQMMVGAICTAFAGIGQSPALAASVVVTVAAILGQASFWIALRAERAEDR